MLTFLNGPNWIRTLKWIAFALCLAVSPATLAQESIFSAGGTFEATKGFIGMPATTWNPRSNGAHPSGMPFVVPKGKTLLVTDIFLETDPLPPFPFLMVLATETEDGTVNTLRTIHLRKPVATYKAVSTPIPVQSGTTLHVLFQNGMPARQSVNWAITGRLVDEVTIEQSAGHPGQAPALAAPYPFPPAFLATNPSPLTVPAVASLMADNLIESAVGSAEFVANSDDGQMARITGITPDGLVQLDRSAGFLAEDVVPVWVADYGTDGELIRDVEAPPCNDIGAVLLLGPFVGKFDVITCQPSQITISTSAKLAPGQLLQYLRKVGELAPPNNSPR